MHFFHDSIYISLIGYFLLPVHGLWLVLNFYVITHVIIDWFIDWLIYEASPPHFHKMQVRLSWHHFSLWVITLRQRIVWREAYCHFLNFQTFLTLEFLRIISAFSGSANLLFEQDDSITSMILFHFFLLSTSEFFWFFYFSTSKNIFSIITFFSFSTSFLLEHFFIHFNFFNQKTISTS